MDFLAEQRVLIPSWLAIWFIRPSYDQNKRLDLVLFVLLRLPVQQMWNHVGDIIIYSTLLVSASILILLLLGILRSSKKTTNKTWHKVNANQPLFLRCRTTHTRMIPKAHSFTYRYLQVCVPICTDIRPTSFFSLDTSSFSLFSLDAQQYLLRNGLHESLQKRLERYLELQNVDRQSWNRAYLVTAPKFLGYSFNPVSFWYIYNARDRLEYMILEVNNTFDERRMYLLRPNDSDASSPAESAKFKNKWPKDFHVSPFNSRKGHYALTANSPFVRGEMIPPGIDNNIVLHSSKEQGKLIARIYSDDQPLAASDFGVYDCVVFLLQWAWSGFFTFPRILKEAFLLFFRRKLFVWLRPEVERQSLGRAATASEKCIESFFHRYLNSCIQQCEQPIKIDYHTGFTESQSLSNVELDSAFTAITQLELRILTPEFYTRLVHYSTVADALRAEGIEATIKSRTMYVSHPDIVFDALLKSEMQPRNFRIGFSFIDRIRWQVLSTLRSSPTALAYSDKSIVSKDSKCSGISSLDHFVTASCPQTWQYRRTVSKILLATRIAFGFSPIIGLVDLILRIALLYYSPLTGFGIHLVEVLKGW